jgi:hypothetical protein
VGRGKREFFQFIVACFQLFNCFFQPVVCFLYIADVGEADKYCPAPVIGYCLGINTYPSFLSVFSQQLEFIDIPDIPAAGLLLFYLFKN